MLLDAGFPPPVVLRLAVAYERSLDAKSSWYGYLASLPEAEDLPLLWPDSALRLLEGTGL